MIIYLIQIEEKYKYIFTFIKKTLIYKSFSTRILIYKGKNNIGVIDRLKGNEKNLIYQGCTVFINQYKLLLKIKVKKLIKINFIYI